MMKTRGTVGKEITNKLGKQQNKTKTINRGIWTDGIRITFYKAVIFK